MADPAGWQNFNNAPIDRFIWAWHSSWAGAPYLIYWNDRSHWWSMKSGAGSCLMSADSEIVKQALWFPAFPPIPRSS